MTFTDTIVFEAADQFRGFSGSSGPSLDVNGIDKEIMTPTKITRRQLEFDQCLIFSRASHRGRSFRRYIAEQCEAKYYEESALEVWS
jgi:hypothetical protein